MNAYDQTLEK